MGKLLDIGGGGGGVVVACSDGEGDVGNEGEGGDSSEGEDDNVDGCGGGEEQHVVMFREDSPSAPRRVSGGSAKAVSSYF